jgi:transposase
MVSLPIKVIMQTDILKYSLGVDVSKKTLAVCLSALGADLRVKIKASRSFGNSDKDFSTLTHWLDKHVSCKEVPLLVAMEATGVYHEACANYFHQQGYFVSIVVPSQAKRYQQSLGMSSKTDSIDAKGLAQMGAERDLPAWRPPAAQLASLRKLSRHREMLQRMKTEVSNRLHAQQHTARMEALIVKQLRQQLKMLEKQERQLEQAMEELLQQDTSFIAKVHKIAASIKGLGALTVASIAAETYGFELFHSQRQLTKYAGYDVVENQSGARKGKTRLSKKGNSHIRRALHFPALNVVRYRIEPFAGFYERVYERTRIKMKGYVAVQRKLLCLIYALWKKDEAFDPEYLRKGHRISQSLSPLFVE